jgi:hypothetical protein
VRVSLRPVNADKTQRDPQKPARCIRASSDHKWQSETPFPPSHQGFGGTRFAGVNSFDRNKPLRRPISTRSGGPGLCGLIRPALLLWNDL